MDYKSLVLLIVMHVVFDFVLQDRETAKKKSSQFSYLLPHLFILAFGLLLYTILSDRYTSWQGFSFMLGNIILHGIIDWNIWKLYKLSVLIRFKNVGNDFEYYNDGMFYNFIALDQALHGLCYLGLDYLVRSA
jgi:hypothetical protein